MIVVSGCPRSGTSLMMYCLHTVLGDKRIVGQKFPGKAQREIMGNKRTGESEKRFAARKYMQEKLRATGPYREDEEREKRMEDMNPNGFWECQYTVRGINWSLQNSKKLESMSSDMAIKIVSQGLANTEPRYIDKMIYMIRHPRQVAKSQEKLDRSLGLVDENGNSLDPSRQDGYVVHTPQMYNNVTVTAAKWLKAFPGVPVLFVEFDDLVADPVGQLTRVGEFIGEDMTPAHECINPRLKRSEPEEMPSELWQDAEEIYNKFKEKDWDGVIDVLSRERSKTREVELRYVCTRTMLTMVVGHCKECWKDEEFRNSLKDYAASQLIDWSVEPCLYECGMDPERESHKSIEDSIAENHWIDANTPS